MAATQTQKEKETPMTNTPQTSDDTKVIRVHTAEGNVYARIMEPMTLPGMGLMYTFIELIEAPAGLTQQGVVNHFRAQGWAVEQDHGTDFDNPEWGD